MYTYVHTGIHVHIRTFRYKVDVKKKFAFTVRTMGWVISLSSRLVSVRLPFLSIFKPFPFCPKGSPSVRRN